MINLPRLKFAHLPTPVEAMPRLGALFGGQKLLVKRDDETGLALGGNKTRKLEFLLAEAQANGARCLVSAGAAQSNHCRQTAAAAARYGLPCTLVLYPTSPGETLPGPHDPPDGNLVLDAWLGADIVWTERAHRDETLKQVFQQQWDEGKRPYMIPYGGSSPAGAAGYVYAMQEFMAQTVQADWIVFPSSSGGTHAGMTVGARLFGYRGKVLGISVDESLPVLQKRVADLASETADLLGEKLRFTADDILANADYLGDGYGMTSASEVEAMRLFARREGLLLDPVYTGRAAAGLIDLLRQGFFKPSETILFWHTGGAPALFADKYKRLALGL